MLSWFGGVCLLHLNQFIWIRLLRLCNLLQAQGEIFHDDIKSVKQPHNPACERKIKKRMGGTGELSERVNKISQILMSSRVPGLGYKGNRWCSFKVRDVKAVAGYLIRKRGKERSSIFNFKCTTTTVLLSTLCVCVCVWCVCACACVCVGTNLNTVIFSGTLEEIKRPKTSLKLSEIFNHYLYSAWGYLMASTKTNTSSAPHSLGRPSTLPDCRNKAVFCLAQVLFAIRRPRLHVFSIHTLFVGTG